MFSKSLATAMPWSLVLLTAAFVTACGGGGRDPVLGTGGATFAPSVTATTPLDATAGVCPASAVTASFTGAPGFRLDPATVNATSFTLTGPGAVPVVASEIVVDAGTGRIAIFRPVAALTPGVTYTAILRGGAAGITDNATPANAMAADFSFSFTAGPNTPACLQQAIGGGAVGPVGNASILASAAPFGTFGGSAGMTNMGTLTIINGDIGTTAVSTAVTGFHSTGPGCTYTEVLGMNMGLVTGRIVTAAPPPTVACPTEGTAETFAIANQARLDAVTAYNALAGLPDGGVPAPANLATQTITPGVYRAPGGSFMIQGGDLTLDAQGDANAIFVFQMASTLTIGGPGAAAPQNVILINNAQAKNVFWQVGTAATINAGGGGTIAGTIIARDGAAVSTAGNVAVVTINGRLLSLGASVTLVNTIINVPAP